MNGIIEKIKRNKLTSSIVLIIVILLIIVVILLLTGTVGVKKLSINGQEAAAVESGLITTEEEIVNVEEVFEKTTETVTFPVFVENGMFDYEGDMTSCDSEIVWVQSEVEATPAILNATLNKMFNFSNDPSYIPGNFIGEQENLSFVEARIDNGIAKIYLEGELVIEDECDADKPWIQLEETALAFDTVSGVQIFLNDELIR